MTDREKALEALNALNDKASKYDDCPNAPELENRLRAKTKAAVGTLSAYLSKPSFEDAVKVVEEKIADQIERHHFFQTQYEQCQTADKQIWLDRASVSASKATHYNEILSALRGAK